MKIVGTQQELSELLRASYHAIDNGFSGMCGYQCDNDTCSIECASRHGVEIEIVPDG